MGQAIQFGYDLNGNITKVISPKGDTVSYTYDPLNRLEKIIYNDAEKWRYGYDANGNVTSVTDAITGTTTRYSYDKNNQVTQQTTGSANTVNYTYDANGNIVSLVAMAGTKATTHGYIYNAIDQLVVMTRNGSNIIKYSYDERGNLVTIDYANGYRILYEYDAANRISRITSSGNSNAMSSYSTYQYDANGNLISVTSVAGGTFTDSYKYDTLNRLVEYKNYYNTYQYEYDETGNRTKEIILNSAGTVISSTIYTYDQANQLTTANGQAYTYDANGNLTSNGSKTFSYDEENRLVEVKDNAGASLAKFTYDDTGKRTSMKTPGGTVFYQYSGDKVVLETDAYNNTLAEYTWDDQGNPITFTKNGITYYYHRSAWGDVNLRDSTGAVVASYSYDPWGKIISQSGSLASANPYRYRGYRYDEVTGLYYLGARYYDPVVGRFITRDTFHGFEDDPASLNQYSYAQNNPIMSIDPNRHWAETLLDFASLSHSTYSFSKNPSLKNAGFLAWDAAATALPFVPGAYIIKGIGEIKNVYKSIKQAPNYPSGFKGVQNGTKKVSVKNQDVLAQLRKVESGQWDKIYKDGYDSKGKKISIHYFQSSKSSKVFDVKVKSGWSNK